MPVENDVNENQPGVLRVFQTKDETKAYYDKIAKVYDLLSERSEQPMREKALEKLAPQPGERILEVGCGTGHSLLTIAKAVGDEGQALGVDISEEMVALTTQLFAEAGLSDRVELHRCDGAQLPLESDSLDGVFASFTLELFDTPEIPEVLAEWKRVLRPGGRLAVLALSKEGRQGLVTKAFEWTHQHFPNLIDCRAIYVRRALEAAGFEICEADVDKMWVPVEIVLGVKR